MDPRKASAEWFHSNVFRDEPIRPQARQAPGTGAGPVPAAIQAARALENGGFRSWQSRESVFLKQGKLLEYYTDECEDCGDVVCYYPTYQSLTNPQLRSYFSWRTRVRLGEVRRTALSFAFLYIYELINQIGVKDPLDGYRKLLAFRDEYGQLDQAILPYLSRWLVEYVVYYGLDPALLADSPKVLFDRSVMVLERIGEMEDAAVAGAVRQLSRWLKQSKFYAQHREDMDEVVVRVLREVSAHYAKGRSKTMTERYFGVLACQGAEPFRTAVFCNPLKRRNYEYAVDEQRVYRCRDGIWSVYSRRAPSTPGGLDRLLKTIDCVMRREFGCSPVKPGVETKWIVRLIETEVQALLARQRAAEAKKITLDPARLSRIRLDAAVIQEKLIVDEEAEVLPEPATVPPTPTEAQAGGDAVPLDPVQTRLLCCLLRGEDTAWVQKEGYLLSVLVDGINDALYEIFEDCVLDGASRPVEDYAGDLKAMVCQ